MINFLLSIIIIITEQYKKNLIFNLCKLKTLDQSSLILFARIDWWYLRFIANETRVTKIASPLKRYRFLSNVNNLGNWW
jgi:hypothetical protein